MFHSLWLLRRKVREIGFHPALAYTAKMICRKFFRPGDVIFALRPYEWEASPPRCPPSFSVCPLNSLAHLSEGDRQILRDYGGDKMVESFTTQFARGATPWVGRIQEQLAGVCWLVPASISSDYFFPLLEGDAVISSCFTIPRHRGKGVFSRILYQIAKSSSKRGLRRIFINCKTWNAPSMRGILKAGFKEIGVANRVRIARRNITIWQRGELK